MKILAIENHPTTKKGGSEKSYFEVLTALKKRGHHVVLAYERPGDLLEKYEGEGITCIKIRATFISSFFSPASILNFLVTSYVLFRQKPDAFYLNYLDSTPIVAFLSFFRSFRSVCHIRIPLIGTSRQFIQASRRIDHFIVLNRRMMSDYQLFIPKHKLRLIHNGVDPDKYKHLKKERCRRLTIGYLGRISPEKGIQDVLNALQTLKEKGHVFQFLIGGDYSTLSGQKYYNELLKFARTYFSGDEVKFIGHVSDISKFYYSLDLFVFPSIWEEPFGRTIPESILHGVPVIYNDKGMVAEILNDSEKKYGYSSVGQLATLIELFDHNPSAYPISTIQEHIRTNFNIENTIKRIEETLMPA